MICAHCTDEVPDAAAHCPSCGKPPALEGRYRLDAIVGHGAHGTTYRSTRLIDAQVVAIKELLVRKVESLKALELFQREVHVLSELDHPGVPDFIEELHVDAGRSVSLYLVQEFVDGATLTVEFEKHRGTERSVFEIAAELLDTLAYLHELRPPVIHRDIKPGNVMRRVSDGSLVLIDFGSVRDAVDTAEGGSTVAGTFGYMAPEQFMGRALPATDVYGVGATIVALLSRKDPQELLGPDRAIDWRGKLGLSPPFAAILESMLIEDPARRAADAAAVATQIRAALRGEFRVPRPALPQPSTPSSPDLLPVPSAPRELPAKFRKEYAASASFGLIFGGAFIFAACFAGLIPLFVAFTTGELFPAAMSVLFFGIFGSIGGFSFARGYRTLLHAKAAYGQGVPTEGFVVDIGTSNYTVNGRSATVYDYEFIVDGKPVRGSHHSWDALDLHAGSTVTVLYVPGSPEQSVLYEPRQFSTETRIREALLQANRDRLRDAERERTVTPVQMDFGDDHEQAVEVAEPAEEQVW